MATRNAQPRSSQQNQRAITKAQPSSTDDKAPFAGGAYQDLDGSLVPANAVHEAENYRVYPHGLIGRGGSELWGAQIPDGLDDNGPLSSVKTGTIITIPAASTRLFTAADLGRWFMHDSGRCDRIIEVLGPYRIVVDDPLTQADSTSAKVVAGIMAELRHEQYGAQIIMVGTKLYFSYTNPITSWSEIFRCGTDAPIEQQSVIRAYGENLAILFNGNQTDGGGIFKIDLEKGIYWIANSAIPTTIITSVEKTESRTYGRRQTYSMSLLKGGLVGRQRYDTGVEVVHESGTCMVGSSGKDYGTVYTERPVGDGSTTMGSLSGAVLTGGYDTIAGWAAVTTFQFGFTFNGTTRNCVGDATGCLSMDQILEKILLAIHDHFPEVTAKLMVNYILFESTLEDSTMGAITAGAGAFDIGAIIGPGTVVNATFTEPCIPDPIIGSAQGIGELEIPKNSSGDYDTHWNAYTLYSSLDVGDEGAHPITRDQNNPELFIRNADIPVAKALIVSVSPSGGVGYSGTVTINASSRAGEFVLGDQGSILRFEGGGTVTLVKYLTSKTFGCEISTTVSERSAAIGGDDSTKQIRVLTVTVFGGVATRISGSAFTAADSGKILFLSNGYEVTLKTYDSTTDSFTVVETDATGNLVAAALDPKTRRWTDTVRDNVFEDHENLRSRITLQSLQQRLFVPLPICNRGDVSGSMMWAAQSGGTHVHYSPAKSMWRHLGGYYYEAEQREEADDNIEEVSIIGSIVTVKCRRKTYKIPTNQFNDIVLKNEATTITKSAGMSILDGAVGVRHFGGVCNIPGMDRQVVVTGEPGIRILTESGYGENLATNRIQKILDRMVPEYSTRYDPVNGWTIWGWLKKLL
jgi:hypothetical protein